MKVRSIAPPVALINAVQRGRHHLLRLHQSLVPAQVAMAELIIGANTAHAMSVAADLRIADALADGPLGLHELADRVGANPDALGRLLRVLISRGVFRRRRDGRYDLTALARTLRWEAPDSMADFARFEGSPEHREHWSHCLDAIRTGEAVVPTLRGMEAFDWLETQGELNRVFNAAMTNISELAAGAVSSAYDFAGYHTIVDVAGGHGRLLAGILSATPTATGVLFDLPHVVAGAGPLLRDHGVAERVRIAEGSFFDAVPDGGDLYVLKNIIHDWPDDEARQILKTVRAATRTGTAVALIECVIPPHDRDFLAKTMDLEMLIYNAGRERTADEYRNLLQQSGFQMTRVVPTRSPLSIVEAKAA
ncbi:hydroxyneurosporene-O-methyltransferase [Mycobacterium sp. JS623]|uniref:methyltransferase n=1 Tax=Mycobacterium sp. JS623 TaxID=212767 RepID=UPI0002A54E1C|nr:methyltransferase [Mycobacterium sp. JS623]AGB20950.1 hydroxyneurosporene-O-methyltransferase [Mycobacterium sp. JS623]